MTFIISFEDGRLPGQIERERADEKDDDDGEIA